MVILEFWLDISFTQKKEKSCFWQISKSLCEHPSMGCNCRRSLFWKTCLLSRTRTNIYCHFLALTFIPLERWRYGVSQHIKFKARLKEIKVLLPGTVQPIFFRLVKWPNLIALNSSLGNSFKRSKVYFPKKYDFF